MIDNFRFIIFLCIYVLIVTTTSFPHFVTFSGNKVKYNCGLGGLRMLQPPLNFLDIGGSCSTSIASLTSSSSTVSPLVSKILLNSYFKILYDL